MALLGNYSPDRVLVVFKGITITGFQDGTFIDIENDEDAFTMHTGSLGDVVRTRNLNRTGKVTMTLMMAALSNDDLMQIHIADLKSGVSTGPFSMVDTSGNTVCVATDAWIKKAPKIERAKESGHCIWVLDCADLEIFAGGNII